MQPKQRSSVASVAANETDSVQKEVRIRARPETVFGFLTDPSRMIEWCRQCGHPGSSSRRCLSAAGREGRRGARPVRRSRSTTASGLHLRLGWRRHGSARANNGRDRASRRGRRNGSDADPSRPSVRWHRSSQPWLEQLSRSARRCRIDRRRRRLRNCSRSRPE